MLHTCVSDNYQKLKYRAGQREVYMKKIIFLTIGLFYVVLFGCHENTQTETRIAIIEPIQHAAMDEIVAGFKKIMAEQYHQPVRIDVENAEADMNLERTIIQKIRDGNYSLVVPIGVDATQMTLAMIHDKPIVSLASNFTESKRQKLKFCQLAVVRDEIPAGKMLRFIHQVYPTLKNLILVHSNVNKVFPEVHETMIAGKKLGIIITPRMVTSLAELYSLEQSFPENAQGILILKDSLIVSGITTLAHLATAKHIPLMTSDQGSIENGAGFALGVHEQKIGESGATLAIKILNGTPACQLPIQTMEKLIVFINKTALTKSGQNIANIQKVSKQLKYAIENLDPIL